MSTTTATNDTTDVQTTELLNDLKTLENWVCWSYEQRDGNKPTKVPKSTETNSKGEVKYAKCNDPDTWGAYDEVISFAESHDEIDGIGYVFDSNSTVMGIDLDDVRDPDTGNLVGWAEDVIETVDSYAEVSPSGTGVHILCHGCLPEGRNKKKHDGGQTEIEMYDSVRFFTMTFNHISASPTTCETRQEAVREVHEVYVAEEEEETVQAGTPTPTRELKLDDEVLIEKAKNASNGRDFSRLWDGDTSGHDGDHSRADMALISHLAFWTQGDASRMESLFSQSGLGKRDKWQNRDDYRERTIKKALSGNSDVYDPDTPGRDDTENTGLGAVEDIEIIDGEYQRVKSQGFDENGNEILDQERLTTFTISVNAYLNDSSEKLVDITVEPSSNMESEYTVVVPTTVFNDRRQFESRVCTGTTTSFYGGKNDLSDIKQIVGHQDAPTRVGTEQIGVQNGELVTPSGVYTKDGSEPKQRYIKNESGMEQKWQINSLDNPDEAQARGIIEHIANTRNKDRFLPALGWYYATLFTDVVRDEEDELPSVMVSAETGAGKTSSLTILAKMFGLDGNPVSAEDTPFAMLKGFSSTTSIPLHVDEYKPSDISKYKIDTFQNLLRKATKGGTEKRGQPDGSEKLYNVSAPVILSGEQNIQGSAEERRMIRTRFLVDSTEEGTETTRYFKELTGKSYTDENGDHQHPEGFDFAEHAKYVHGWSIQQDRDKIAQIWRNCKQYVYEYVHEDRDISLSELELTALTMIRFGTLVIKSLADELNADLSLIPTDEEVESAINYILSTMGKENRTSHVEEFLQLMSDAASDGKLESGKQYAVIHAGTEKEQLLIKVRPVYHKLSQYLSEHSLDGYDLMNSADDYCSRMKDMEDDQYIEDTNKRHRDLSRCVALDTDDLSTLDNFDFGAFC